MKKWFVSNKKGLAPLERIVRREGCNTYSHAGLNQPEGKPVVIHAGYDRNPDSDWGRYEGHRLRVIITNRDLVGEAEQAIARGIRKAGAIS